ncbi:MAG: tetratricopeptide repeat protein [Phycisphaerales bacterium]
MAARVNTKLLLMLVAGLLVVAIGAVGLGMWAIKNSPARNVARGDEMAAAGDYRAAADAYSRAVNKDQTNIDYILLWLDALESVTPRDQTEAAEMYQKISGLRRKLTLIRSTDPDLQEQWLDSVYSFARSRNLDQRRLEDFDALADAAETAAQALPTEGSGETHPIALKYRGLANVNRMQRGKLTPAERDGALVDLETAFASRPDDSDIAMGILTWRVAEANRLARENNRDAAAAMIQGNEETEGAVAFARSFAERHPDDPMGWLGLLEVQRLEASIDGEISDDEREQLYLTAEKLEESLASGQPDWWTSIVSARAIAQIDESRRAGNERGLRVMQDIAGRVDGDPHPRLTFEIASFHRQLDRDEDAIATYQQLIDRSNVPSSFDSLWLFALRREAAARQFEIAFDSWRKIDKEVDPQGWENAKAEALDRRQGFAAFTHEADPQLLFMDGRMDFMAEDFHKAAEKFNQYAARTQSQDIPFYLIAAQTQLQLQNNGVAYDLLRDANSTVEVRYGQESPPLLIEMIKLDLTTGRVERARELFARLERLETGSYAAEVDALRDRLVLAQQGISREASEQITNPSLRAVIEALSLANEDGDSAAAIARLEQENASRPADRIIVPQLVRFYIDAGESDKALDLIRRARQAAPDEPLFAMLEAEVDPAVDMLDRMAEIVEERPGLSPAEKKLELARIYLRYPRSIDDRDGRSGQQIAQSLVDEAAALEPQNPEVLEAQFVMTLANSTLDPGARVTRLDSIAQRAVDTNADRANGLTFTGRLKLEKGDIDGAIADLRRVVERNPYDATAHRFLAVAYRRANRLSNALESFENAIQRKPDDVISLREYAMLMVELNQGQAAIEKVDAALAISPASLELQNLRLDLQAQFGDLAEALAVRQQRYERDPGNFANAVQYASMLLESGEFEIAERVIFGLEPEAGSESQQLDRLKAIAGLHSARGEYDKAFEALEPEDAEAFSPAAQLDLLLTRAGLHARLGENDEVVANLEAARRFQDPDRLEADLSLARHYESRREFERALEIYESMFRANPQLEIASINIARMHRTLGLEARRQGDDAAQRGEALASHIEAHEESFGASVETRLLRAAAAEMRGQVQAAGQMYDLAVEDHRSDPQVYLARARFHGRRLLENGGASDSFTRIVSDINETLRLSPGDQAALFVLLEAARTVDNREQQLIAYERLVEQNPRSREYRRELIQYLRRTGDYDRARSEAEKALAMEAGAQLAGWHEILGDIAIDSNQGTQAALSEYQKAYELEPTRDRQLKMAQALTEAGRHSEAIELLNKNEQRLESDALLRISRAQALHLSGQKDAAIDDLRAAFELIRASEPDASASDAVKVAAADARRAALRAWTSVLTAATGALDEADTIIASLPDGPSSTWAQIYLLQRFFEQGDAARREDAVARLEQLESEFESAATGADDPDLPAQRLTVASMLAAAHTANREWERSVDAWATVIELNPNDATSANNLAYILAVELNRPREALEPAELAYRVRPRDANILDTYGYVLYLNDRLEEAEDILNEAIQIRPLIAAYVHLAKVYVAMEQWDAAGLEIAQARRLMERTNDTRYATEIDEIEIRVAEEAGADR